MKPTLTVKNISTLITFSLLLFVMSCSEDLITGFKPDKDLPTLYGIVTEANTNAPMDSVMISWFDNRDSLGTASVYTDKNGNYSIEGLAYGNYRFTIYKDTSYATIIDNYSLSPWYLDESGATNAEAATFDNIRRENNITMYALNAGVSGTVYKTVNDSTTPADTAAVTLTVGSSFSPSIYTTTTDSAGGYSFANLPASGTAATIAVLPHSDGTNNFNYNSNNQLLYSGATIASQDITVSLNEGVVVVTNNNIESGYVGISDSIAFTFSHAMDPASVEISGLSVTYDVSWPAVYSLVINPHDNLVAGSTHNISISGLATDSAPLTTGSISFMVEKGMELLWTNAIIGNNTNHTHFPVSSSIKMLFSKTPDLTNSDNLIVLTNTTANPDIIFATSVSLNGDTLIVNPAINLDWNSAHTLSYRLHSTAAGYFVNSTSTSFTTAKYSGIEYVSSNIYIDDMTAGADNFNFAVNSNIEIVFNMVPNTSNSGTVIVLTDPAPNPDIIIDAAISVTGNTLIINPHQDLSFNTAYTVSYTVFSSTAGDFAQNNSMTFTTSNDGIYEVWTNINDYDSNEFPVDSTIQILFSKTPSITNINTSVTLTDEDITGDLKVMSALTVLGDTLIITPEDDLEADRNYKVNYTVYSNATGAGDNTGATNITFTTKRAYTGVPTAISTFVIDQITMGSGTYTDILHTFSFDWTGADDADGYYIYAKDNLHNPDYINVTEGANNDVSGKILDSDHLEMYGTTLTLPNNTTVNDGIITFDRYDDDGVQTPLAGITISFVVTAYNDYGESPISNVRTFADNAKPTAATPVEASTPLHNTANNTSNSNSLIYTITIAFNELMNTTTVPIPVIADGSGSNAYVLPNSTMSTAWNDGGRGLTVILTIPTSSNASGDLILITSNYLKDLTGNEIATNITITLN